MNHNSLAHTDATTESEWLIAQLNLLVIVTWLLDGS